MADTEDDEKPAAPDGVRILGAEEAQAALDGETGRVPPGRPRHGDRPTAPDPSARPSMTFPSSSTGPTGVGATWSASPASSAPSGAAPPAAPPEADVVESTPAAEQGADTGSTEAVPTLPHWSEPPTGQMPAIFAESEDAPDDDESEGAWAALTGTGPRFRAEGTDWAEADFRAELTDESARVGVAAEVPPDSDATFAEEVAARRQVSTRRTSASAGARGAAARPRTATAGQEAAAEMGAAPSEGRDLPTALLTAGIIAVVAFACFNSGTTATGYLSAAILGVATIELAQGLRSKGFKSATVLALLGSVGLVVSAREYGVSAYPIFFGLVAVFSMLWFLWEVTPGRPLPGVATTMFAFGYVGGLGGFAGLLLQSRDGVGLILGVVICTVAYDVFGFFIGSQFGKSHIAPKVSPNKTFEGTLAGMTASVVLGWAIVGGGLAGDGIHPWDSKSGLALGMLVAIGAFLGDLCESMLKRDLGLKDFGTLLPGHGGVLDRFDALLFCLPITYYLAVHLNVL